MMQMNAQLVKSAIKIVNIISPQLAYDLLKKQLLFPKNQPEQWPDDVIKVVFKTPFGNVNTYKYGSGKCIWLLHGWSNAFQYWPLMKKLASQGYSCIAIEMPPVNQVHRISMSLPNWIKAFDLATKNIHEPAHVIAQGIGASVLANSCWLSNYQYDLTLISPVLHYLNSLKSFVRKNNIPEALLNRLVNEVLAQDKVHLKDLDATVSINNFPGRVSIFYSKLDDFTSIQAIKIIASSENRKVVHFKGATTHKIINSRSLVCAINAKDNSLGMAV